MSLAEHWRRAGRLPELLDDAIAPAERARIEAHASRCRRCARRLDRLERSEALLARMPHLLFPLEAVAGDPDGRLATLAQWGVAPAPRSPYGSVPVISALAMAGLAFILSLTGPEWAPLVGDMGASTTVASVLPDSSLYPLTFR